MSSEIRDLCVEESCDETIQFLSDVRLDNAITGIAYCGDATRVVYDYEKMVDVYTAMLKEDAADVYKTEGELVAGAELMVEDAIRATQFFKANGPTPVIVKTLSV